MEAAEVGAVPAAAVEASRAVAQAGVPSAAENA